MPAREEIWIFRIGALGDALVALPAIQRIRDLHPGTPLVLLTNTPGGPIVDSWDILRHAGVFERAEHYKTGGLLSMLGLLPRLWRSRPRVLYYLAPTRRSRLRRLRDRLFFGILGGIPSIKGLDRPQISDPADFSVRVDKEADRLLHLVDPLATPASLTRKRLLEAPAEAWPRVRALLLEAGWEEGRPLVAVTAGSKMPAKRWAPERFREVGERLTCRHPEVFLALLGSPEEEAVAAAISAGWQGRAANLAGKTSLMEAAALLERSRFYLGNDTGTMHLAAAMGVPSVAIFSARDRAGKWEPFGDGNRILRADVPCAGCLRHVCEDERAMACLRNIEIDMVEAAALEFLQS